VNVSVRQPTPANEFLLTRNSFTPETIAYFDRLGKDYPRYERRMRFYVRHTCQFLQQVIPPDQKVLLIGCLSHEILEALQPSVGVGLDASEEIVRAASVRNGSSRIRYVAGVPESADLAEKFDYVILLNVVDYSSDVFYLFESLNRFLHPHSRVIVTMLNPLWHTAAKLASKLKIRIPDSPRNLVAGRVISTALEVKSFRIGGIYRRQLLPRYIPLVSRFVNQYLGRLPPFDRLGFSQYLIARPALRPSTGRPPTCSVIIPCYNEQGNIAECIARVPSMGGETEIVVVNDGSRDETRNIVRAIAQRQSNVVFIDYEKNRGKGYAVLTGIKQAKGDVVMILDADMTVPPEELIEFYQAIETQTADFVSGTRFLYPMEKEAMRWANYLGNIVFSKLIEVIVGSQCSDTLCGTKAFFRKDFVNLELKDFSWGDFDLIFHGARRKLKSIEIPVHYKNRVRGTSKMRPFKAGVVFLQQCLRKWSELE